MKYVFLLFIFLNFIGCTAKKLAINHADDLIAYEVQKRLPLNSAQKKELDQDLVKFLNETKPMARDVLPIIDQIDLNNSDNIKPKYEKLAGFYQDLIHDFTAILSKHLAHLDQEQQRDFFIIVDEENVKFKNKSKERRMAEIEARYELFLGDIVPDQRKVLEKHKEYFAARAQSRYEHRIKLRKDFADVYQRYKDSSSRREHFQKLFNQFHEMNMSGNKNVELLQEFIPTLAPRQKENLREKLQEIQELVKYYLTVEY